MKTANVLIFISLFSSLVFANNSTWQSLSTDEKAELLYDLEYARKENLPEGTQVLELVTWKNSDTFKVADIKNPKHRAVVAKAIQVFDENVSREAIEQSPYSTYGPEQLRGLYLLVDQTHQVLGGSISYYQDGRDQDGNDSDVNWQAMIRFDETGELFKLDSGEPVDELRFEWSGH